MTRCKDEPEPADRDAAGSGPGADRLSLETRRVYDGAWQAFVASCASQDWPAALPVPPERVIAYIESLSPSLGPNGLKLRMAAIAEHHRERGSTSPTAHAAVTSCKGTAEPLAISRRLEALVVASRLGPERRERTRMRWHLADDLLIGRIQDRIDAVIQRQRPEQQ